MENTKITFTYIQLLKIVSIAIIFSVSIPVVASAQYDYEFTSNIIDGGYDQLSNGYDYTYTPTVINNSGYNQLSSGFNYTYTPSVVSSGYNNLSSGYDYAYTPSVVSSGYNYYDTASNGGYNYYDTASNGGSNYQNGYNNIAMSGGYYNGYGSYSPYYNGNYSTVSSGSFSAKNNQSTPSDVYMPATSTVASASFYGGNYADPYYQSSYYYNQPINYNYSQPTYSQVTQPTLTSNQVLAYTDTNSALDSVYLSDIPSTGFDDYYGILMFMSLLISWSAILAYIFLKRKIEAETKTVEVCADTTKSNKIENLVNANLLNNIITDNSDISKVEEYSRMYKVLLSSDASAKIVKLSRLGQINASEYIRGIATGEWIAIGESQIK